jgi:hypothetical protein
MTNLDTFKRGQIVWALWRAFSQRDVEPPPAFSTRLRKMGELGVPISLKERPGQAGIDIDYGVHQAFELGVSLKCLDAGLKQGEVAFFIHHIRQDLRKVYCNIMENPPVLGLNVLGRDRPNSPRCMVVTGGDTGLKNPDRSHQADTSYYMTFRSVELRELWSARKPSKGEPFIFEPKFHRGLEAVALEIERLAHYIGDDIRVIIELSNLAVSITEALKLAPQRRRGRQ